MDTIIFHPAIYVIASRIEVIGYLAQLPFLPSLSMFKINYPCRSVLSVVYYYFD